MSQPGSICPAFLLSGRKNYFFLAKTLDNNIALCDNIIIKTAGIDRKEVKPMRANKKALRLLLSVLADIAVIAGFILILIDRIG